MLKSIWLAVSRFDSPTGHAAPAVLLVAATTFYCGGVDDLDAERADFALAALPEGAAEGFRQLAFDCDAGSLDSCVDLARALADGYCIPQDFESSALLLTHACSLSSLDACAELGKYYMNGMGVPHDLEMASDLLIDACEAGSVWACLHRRMLMSIWDVGSNEEFERLTAVIDAQLPGICDSGDAESCMLLGSWSTAAFRRQESPDPGLLVTAASYFEQACELGSQLGCIELELVRDPTLPMTRLERYVNDAGWHWWRGDARACSLGLSVQACLSVSLLAREAIIGAPTDYILKWAQWLGHDRNCSDAELASNRR